MDKQFKKLIPGIYLYKEQAVRDLKDHEVISTSPAELAAEYDNGYTDALMIFDLSDTDREQEAHNDLIREICGKVRIPVIAAGRVRRMEDVKKFLYAGCAMACLNLSKETNAQIAAEVADKFGADKIAACFTRAEQIEKYGPLLADNVSLYIYVGEGPLKDPGEIVSGIPVIAQITGNDCVKETLARAWIHGVTGTGVNKRIGKLAYVRNKLDASGIPVKIRKAAYKWKEFKLGPDGLLPVVVQESSTDQVLMVAYMKREAYEMTVATVNAL